MFSTQTLEFKNELSVLCVAFEEVMKNNCTVWSCCWVACCNGAFYRLILMSMDKYDGNFCSSLKSPLEKNPYPPTSLSCCAGSYDAHTLPRSGHIAHTKDRSGCLWRSTLPTPGRDRSCVPGPAASPAGTAACPASICVPGHLTTCVDANSANGEVAAQ